jgi:hypothetical protein
LKSGLKPDAFKYCTTIIHRTFLQVLAKEKRHSELKDNLIRIAESVNHQEEGFYILENIIIDEEKDGV